MRINQYIALATGISRRAADELIKQGRVLANGQIAPPGLRITAEAITLDGKKLVLPPATTLIMLNKPAGYVCSRDGQGSKTIYNLLPAKFYKLKTIGRLDKDSSGLILLTDNGQLAQELSHPSQQKIKSYEVKLDKILSNEDLGKLLVGVELEDGQSKFYSAQIIPKGTIKVGLTEGRNRQIRRTFKALGYDVLNLRRTSFGQYKLGGLSPGKITEIIVE